MRQLAYTFVLSASIAGIASAQAIPDNLVPSTEAVSSTRSGLPPIPPGRSTVMGGEIQNVDMVRDQFALKVPAGHTMKILFDERTQVFRNGKRISMLDLHPADHASIETTLDGTAIFALRVHIASDLPDGQLRGEVERYNRANGELRLLLSGTTDSVTVIVGQSTPVARVGHEGFAAQKSGTTDLVPGSLVEVTFKSGKGRPGAATKVDVIAIPGAEFIFIGSVSFLDLRAGRLSLQDSSDRPTDISFDPSRFTISHDLHQGSLVKIRARFDGNRYVASDISIN